MQFKVFWQAFTVIIVMGASPALAAPNCPINGKAHAEVKPNKLYLLFPERELPDPYDPLRFPASGFDSQTKWLPLGFDISKLRGYTEPQPGHPDPTRTAAALRNRIYDVVADIYCEFNVQVIPIVRPLKPATGKELRNVVGIGTGVIADRPCSKRAFGQAATAGGDPGDSTAVDFARVWAGYFQRCAGTAVSGRELFGSNSTLDRWADSIGSAAAHEAGHNYGLGHADGHERRSSGEDGFERHLMREGGAYAFKDRAARRHFSDWETSVLARIVGLAIDTMWTWEFTNSNVQTGAKLRMEILSTNPKLILSWAFSENSSPWINPTLSGPSGTRSFKEQTYHVYTIEWSAGNQRWKTPEHPERTPGQVPPNERFQVGATFSSVSRSDPAPVIITDVTLLDADGHALPQRAQWMGFDAGNFNDNTGDLNVRFFNFLNRPLTLRDVVIQDLPRVMSIKAMMPGANIIDVLGRKFKPWDRGETLHPESAGSPQVPLLQYTINPGGEIEVLVANRAQGRHISAQRTHADCAPKPDESGRPCHPGVTVDDLFPATTMYLTATVVDSEGGAESKLFYQIAGRYARLP